MVADLREEIQLRYLLTLYLPIGLAVVGLLVFYVVLGLYLVVKGRLTKEAKLVPEFIFFLVKLTFRASGLNKKGYGEVEREYRLYGYRVPAPLVNALGLSGVIVWICVMTAFWLVLIGKGEVTISEDCDFNATLLCTELFHNTVVLDYVRAMGAAGGLLILTAVIIQGQLIVLMWIMKKSRNHNKNIRRAWKLTALSFVIVPLLTSISAFVWMAKSAVDWEVYDSEQKWIKLGSFAIVIFQSSYFSTVILYYTWARRTKFKEDIQNRKDWGAKLDREEHDIQIVESGGSRNDKKRELNDPLLAQ